VATTIEQLSERAILLTIDTDLATGENLRVMIKSVGARLNTLFDQAGEPQTLIIQDAHNMRLNFSILVEALGVTAARGESAFFAHDNLDQVIFVTRNNLVRVAATALSQREHGGLKASVVPTLEDALTLLDS
jgi:hypothetical protein